MLSSLILPLMTYGQLLPTLWLNVQSGGKLKENKKKPQ